jgi:hypothetical protein
MSKELKYQSPEAKDLGRDESGSPDRHGLDNDRAIEVAVQGWMSHEDCGKERPSTETQTHRGEFIGEYPNSEALI